MLIAPSRHCAVTSHAMMPPMLPDTAPAMAPVAALPHVMHMASGATAPEVMMPMNRYTHPLFSPILSSTMPATPMRRPHTRITARLTLMRAADEAVGTRYVL